MRSVIQSNKKSCYLCRRIKELDNHHVFNGAYKKKSEADGMIVYLCRDCHRKLHDNYSIELEVKQEAERIWLSQHSNDTEAFIKRFGKNYL